MKDRIYCVDGMKGMAALLIACVGHLQTVPLPLSNGLPFSNLQIFRWVYSNGGLFVEFFFVCSGFLAFLCYTDKIINHANLTKISADGAIFPKGGGYSFVEFIKRRICRIFPLMWVTLIASVTLSLIWYFLHDHVAWLAVSTDTIFSLGLSFFGLQILGGGQAWNYPAWCLIYFFLCWCIYYIIIYFSKGKKSFQVISCIVMIILGISLQVDEWGRMALLNAAASRGYVSFFAGGILYHVYVGVKETDWKQKCVGYCFLWLILCALIRFAGIDWGPKSAAFSLFIFSPFILLVLCFKPLKCLFSLKVMRFLGEISFSIYLCNYSIELFVALINDTFHLGIDLTSEMQWGVYVLFHIGVAAFVHYIIEKKVATKMEAVLSCDGGDNK